MKTQKQKLITNMCYYDHQCNPSLLKDYFYGSLWYYIMHHITNPPHQSGIHPDFVDRRLELSMHMHDHIEKQSWIRRTLFHLRESIKRIFRRYFVYTKIKGYHWHAHHKVKIIHKPSLLSLWRDYGVLHKQILLWKQIRLLFKTISRRKVTLFWHSNRSIILIEQ